MDINTIGWILAFSAVIGAVLSIRNTLWLSVFGVVFLVGLASIAWTSRRLPKGKRRKGK